jgi:ring-1,2-phenylacetyl-CoA epoxidase subunit PaaD
VSVVLAARPLEAVVRARLEEVDDPEIPGVSIVDLGIVHDVRVGTNEIRIELLPTFVGCPALDVMRDAVIVRIADLAEHVRVDFTFAEPWSAARITPTGRAALTARGFAPPVGGAGAGGDADGSALPVLPIAQCPYCGSRRATLENAFGPTLCRAIYYCADCQQPFEQFKSV